MHSDPGARYARGSTNADIADDLDISLSTVKTHIAALMRKLHAGNRVEIAMLGCVKDHPPRPVASLRCGSAHCQQAGCRLSASTVRTIYAVLRAALGIAFRDGLLRSNPVAAVRGPASSARTRHT